MKMNKLACEVNDYSVHHGEFMLSLTCNIFLSSGVAVGAGMQGIVAVVNLVCYYGIGIPAGALLGYLTSLQVKVYYDP